MTLTWPLRRPVNKSGPSSLSVTLQPTVTRPKETTASFGPSHYIPKPFSNTIIDSAITRVRQNKYKSSAHTKHTIFMVRHLTEKFCILLMSCIHILATINTLRLMQMNSNSVEVVFIDQTTLIEWYIFWDQIQYQRYSVLKDADGAWSKKKKMRYMFTVWCSLLAVDAKKNSSQWHLLIKSTDKNRNNLKQSWYHLWKDIQLSDVFSTVVCGFS